MIETKAAYISLIENDILRIEFKKDAFVDLEEYEENLKVYRELMTTDKAYLLTIANPGASISLAVRNKFSTAERSSFKIAEAFVISTFAQKIIATFVMRVQKPPHILRFFNNEKDAAEWLLKVRSEQYCLLS